MVFLDDMKSRKKSESAILEGIQELLRLSSNGCEDIKNHYKSLQEYLSKVLEDSFYLTLLAH